MRMSRVHLYDSQRPKHHIHFSFLVIIERETRLYISGAHSDSLHPVHSYFLTLFLDLHSFLADQHERQS